MFLKFGCILGDLVAQRNGEMAEMVQSLPTKHEALSSKASTTPPKKSPSDYFGLLVFFFSL
jgi:hypothetical protein